MRVGRPVFVKQEWSMWKRKKLLAALVSVTLVAGLAALLVGLVKHEPGFYRRAAILAGKDRMECSRNCIGQVTSLLAAWLDGPKEPWEVNLSEAHLNSYFEEDFVRLGDAEALRKQGISDPRVVFEDDRIRLAFRYGSGFWSTIVSYDLKVWLAPKDINVVCVEILNRHAGGLPITSQSFLQDISEVAAKRGIEVNWYRHEGKPVALVRFQADRSRPTSQLRRLEVKQGLLTIGGISLEPVQTGTLKRALAPVGN